MKINIGLALIFGFLLVCGVAHANVWIDESFDDGIAFDHAPGNATGGDVDPFSDEDGDGLDDGSVDPITAVLHTGSISSARAFNGTRSYLLASGQAISVATPSHAGSGPYQYLQMAVSVASVGTGTMAVTNDADVSSATVYIGYGNGSNGTVTIDGTGSTWNNSTGTLYVGYDGTGSLAVTNEAEVSSASGCIGYNTNSDGTVTVGSGSQWTNSGNLYVGGNATTSGGNADLR